VINSSEGAFIGNVLNGEKNGIGRLDYSDGGYYIGRFKNSMPCGEGIQVLDCGTVRKGIFNLNEFHAFDFNEAILI